MSHKNDSRHPGYHPDPITGAPDAHPVGTGVGAVAGGAAGLGVAAATGAAVGSAVGPVGAIAGAAIGAVAGGLVGKAVAEEVNPEVEDTYWRENFSRRPYVRQNAKYEEYSPAYRYGWEGRSRFGVKKYEEIEGDLERDWDKFRNSCRLNWREAKHAVRDGWDRLSSKH